MLIRQEILSCNTSNRDAVWNSSETHMTVKQVRECAKSTALRNLRHNMITKTSSSQMKYLKSLNVTNILIYVKYFENFVGGKCLMIVAMTDENISSKKK